MIKVVIVDDHLIFRRGLSLLLHEIEEVEILAEASDGIMLLELLKTNKPDLIFMDIKMPNMNGIEATKNVLAKYPDIKILALSMFGEEEYLQAMIDAGVEGFILKKAEKEEIENAIKIVMEGKSYFSHELFDMLVRNFGLKNNKIVTTKKEDVKETPKLSNRELEVLKLICKGISNNVIAETLFISPRTVDGHKASILSKTGMKNTANLILYSISNKLFEMD